MAAPISDTVFHIKRSAVDGKAPTLAGIDRGCSLTKAMYLPKNGSDGTKTHYAFHCVMYHNDNFTECLRFLKKNAKLPDKGIIRVTGAGGDKYRNNIREILGLNVEFVHEHVSIISGFHQFVQAVDDHKELFYPKLTVKSYVNEFDESMHAMIAEMKKDVCKNDGSDPMFPCLYVHVGTGVGFMQINADGSTKFLGETMSGGKTLVALGKTVAGIDNYEELMKLAMAGEAGNVDTTVGEILPEDGKSEYGSFSKDMPLFSFGKVVDQKRSIDKYDKKDRAASAVRFFADILFTPVTSIALSLGISKVIFGGSGIGGEALRRDLSVCSNLFLDSVLNIRFLKTGGVGAFGAMVTPVEPAQASQKKK